MKKRLLSALLALALVFVLLPTTALAETPAIKIAGTVIEDGKYYYTNGGIGELKTEAQQKTWNVRRDGNTLYLKNAKINTTDTQSIQVWMMSVTINLEGDSTIKTKGEGSIVSQFAGSLTINGNGKLTIESNTAGSSIVWNSGDVTITGDAVVNITNENSGQLSDAIGLASSYELTVSENAKLRAVSNGSKAATVNGGNLTIADNAEFNVINQNSSGKAVSFKSIEVAAGYDCNGINGNGITDWTKTTAEELNTFQKVWVKPTPTPTLEKSNVCVAGTNLYKNTAYTIQNGKPVMGGTYPDNYNIYLDATGSNYVLHVKDAVIEATGNARGTTGIYGTSNIVFEGDNSITASTYGIYSYFTQSDLKISGTGSLNVKTIAGEPAIATAYDTSRSIIISGNDFTVTADTSGTTSYAIKSDKDLTITGGAAVTAKSNATRAIDIKGDLTVTNGSLTATSTSNNVPTVQVGGNASFTGSTVTITNNSTTQGKSGKNSYEVSTGLYVGGTLDIKNAAKVTSTVIGGNAIYAKGDITISGDSTEVKATNDAYKFSAISTNKTVNISDNSTVKAENLKKHQGDPTGETDPSTGKTYNACPAITGKIANKNTQNNLHIAGFTTSNAGSQNPTEETPLNLDIAPGSVEPYIHHYNVTITRGDKVTRTNSPVVIAGTTLLNDTFYTINGSTVAEGTESNYNAFYNSTTKTLKLNNAQISHSFAHEYGGGQDGAIIFKEFENYFIELSGENTISSTNTYAINCYRPDRTLTIKNAAEAENAKLTLTSNWMVICSIGGLNIQSDVTMVNTKEAGYLMYVNDTFSFDGYNAYASVNASGSPLVEYTVPTSGDKDAGYQYLRITKETLETGGGSTHEHVFSTSWESNADYHWHKCTVQGCTEVSDKEEHVYTNTWWKNSNGNHGRTCDKCRHEGEIHEFRKYYNFVDATYHVERCSYPNCTYVGSNETHSYDSFGTCKCGYNPNGLPAPPSLQGVAPTSENGTDGKILNSNIGMEYAQNLNGPWTKWNEHSNITGLSAGTYYVRYTKTDERFPDNQVATVEVPAYTPGGDPTPDIPAAPTGLVGVAPTSENENGKITGTTAQMEYASSLEGDWTTCANDSTDVPAGKYYVRMKKTDNTPAGEVVEVTVPAYSGTGEITPDPTPDNPGTIVIIRPAEEEKPAQQPNPSTGANDLVGLAVAAAVAAALGSAALLRKHD
jgi:hypothetical protein